MRGLAGKCLIDTNILIYATYRDDPRFDIATAVISAARKRQFEALVSVQNLAEMYPKLTGSKRKHPDSPALARAKIDSIARLGFVQVLPVDEAVVDLALELCEQHVVRRQDYFDMQLAATMLVHGVRIIVTENTSDFEKVSAIRAVNPFL